jgi:iron complex outermembrane recepter protein
MKNNNLGLQPRSGMHAAAGPASLWAAAGLFWQGGCGVAHAQSGEASGPPVLTEVVVTAERRGAESISRVPMSITAETQKSLDDLSIKTGQDLARIVPALNVSANGATGSNISIRGIASTNGAATTGIYLDDSALQARNLLGIATGGGVFLPMLFDLERVEVLKGPQGTLYGGSSEGGTIRFITPEPGLSTYSGYAKAELNTVESGGPGGEFGAAVGGPLALDKAGFRLSVWGRRIGGWIDHVDWRNPGTTIASDTNSEDQQAYRLAFKLVPVEDLSITPALYYGWDRKNDGDTVYNSISSFTTPAFGTLVSTGRPIANGGLLPAGYSPTGAVPCSTAPTLVSCYTNVPGYIGKEVFIHPAHTYPAVPLGRYDTIVNTMAGNSYTGPVAPQLSGRKSTLFLPSLAFEYRFGPAAVKSITSYVRDGSDGDLNLSAQEIPNTTATAGYAYQVQSPYVFDLVTPFQGNYYYRARRNGISEELRISSTDPRSRFGWIGGIYFNNARTFSSNFAPENRTDLQLALFGHPQAYTGASQADIDTQNQVSTNQWLQEKQWAGFGEINFALLDALKLIAGVRWSREEIDFTQWQWGLIYRTSVSNPIVTTGSVVERPVTPKVGLSWQATPNDLFYVTAAKGYRAGGVQGQASPVQCAADLAALGISSTPSTYGSDAVWSYEGGTKINAWDSRARFAGSVFYTSWNKPQTPYTLPTCVFNYITNIGKAVSKGFDLQATINPMGGLALDLAVAYTDAHYTQQVNAVNGALLVANGQDFVGIPNWSGNVGGRYDWPFSERLTGYFQANYQYLGRFKNSSGPGTGSYSPDYYITPSRNYLIARMGLTWGNYDVSLFADNLLNEDTLVPSTLGGRYGCRNTDCSVFGSYYQDVKGVRLRPRQVGITATLRY